MTFNTDNLTTITGTIAALSATLSSYGIYPEYSTPVAGIFGSIFAVFSKGISIDKKF